MMMKYSGLLLLGFLLITVSCSPKKNLPPDEALSYQAISARGDTLYAPKLTKENQQKYEARLRKARKAYKAHPDRAALLMTYAQCTARMGHYREAIRIYGKGIEKHPDDAHLYQQRGRQYIITRQFDNARADLKKAGDLLEKNHRQLTPMLRTDLWFQRGLAQYLAGDFKQAAGALQKSLDAAPKDNMRVKASYWLYTSLRRAGMDLQAGKVLNPISAEMNLSENENYLKLLLVFKGDFEEKSLLNDSKTPLDDATIGYGLGNWHYINGRKKRAEELFKKVCRNDHWNFIGYIAAETDLARLF